MSDAVEAHRLFHQNRPDFPSTPATEADDYTLDEMRQLIGANPAFGVWHQEHLIALTVLRRRRDVAAETDFTVTDRAWRGQGLATAVKALSVSTLAGEGVAHFGTGGAQVNEASLKANQHLGYHIEPLWLTYTNG